MSTGIPDGGSERKKVMAMALNKANLLSKSLSCNTTASAVYNLSMPARTNRTTAYYTPLIFGFRFWWECSLSITKKCSNNCSNNCCKEITVQTDCKFHALDHVNFWTHSYSVAWIPPYMIYDRLVRACNPKGRGFDVFSNISDSLTESLPCKEEPSFVL